VRGRPHRPRESRPTPRYVNTRARLRHDALAPAAQSPVPQTRAHSAIDSRVVKVSHDRKMSFGLLAYLVGPTVNRR